MSTKRSKMIFDTEKNEVVEGDLPEEVVAPVIVQPKKVVRADITPLISFYNKAGSPATFLVSGDIDVIKALTGTGIDKNKITVIEPSLPKAEEVKALGLSVNQLDIKDFVVVRKFDFVITLEGDPLSYVNYVSDNGCLITRDAKLSSEFLKSFTVTNKNGYAVIFRK